MRHIKLFEEYSTNEGAVKAALQDIVDGAYDNIKVWLGGEQETSDDYDKNKKAIEDNIDKYFETLSDKYKEFAKHNKESIVDLICDELLNSKIEESTSDKLEISTVNFGEAEKALQNKQGIVAMDCKIDPLELADELAKKLHDNHFVTGDYVEMTYDKTLTFSEIFVVMTKEDSADVFLVFRNGKDPGHEYAAYEGWLRKEHLTSIESYFDDTDDDTDPAGGHGLHSHI